MKKNKLLAMFLVLVFLFTTLVSFNVLNVGASTSIHVMIKSGDLSISTVAIKMTGIATPIKLKTNNGFLYYGPDGGDDVFDKITDIIVTKKNGEVLTYSPASNFGRGVEAGGTINYYIYAQSDGTHIIPDFDITKTVNPLTAYTGDVVTYSFEVTNNQSAALNNVTVNDPLLGGLIQTMDIGANGKKSFTKTYTTTLSDFENGVVNNTATASVTCNLEGEDKQIGTVTVTETASASYTVSGYTLETRRTGQGVVTTVPPPQATGPNANKYSKGTVVTFGAEAAVGWQFDHWSNDEGFTVPDSESKTVLMDSDKVVNAIFIPMNNVQSYTLKIFKEGSGTVIPSVGEHFYLDGDEVTLSAIAADGWHFDGWSNEQGFTVPNSETNTVSMDSNKAVKAIFTQVIIPEVYHTLTVNKVGSGTVIPNTGTHSYLAGTQVELTASPASGWVFDGWSGDVTGSSVSATLGMTSDKSVTATFKYPTTPTTPYTPTTVVEEVILNVSVTGQGTVLPTPGDHKYNKGVFVQLTIQPQEGWEFIGWQGDPVEANNQVYMDRNKNIVAVFKEIIVIEETPTVEPVVTTPEVIILEEEVPTAAPELPKTGGIPTDIFYGLGGLITAVGVILKRKSK